MEVKKTEKASLGNKRLLFTEIGLVLALLVVWGAFEYSTKDKKTKILEAVSLSPKTPLPRRPRLLSPSFPILSILWMTTSRLKTTS